MNIKEIFIRGAWENIVSDEKTDWIDNEIENYDEESKDIPCGDLGLILKKMTNAGIDKKLLARFAKIMQFDLLAGLCYYLEDPTIYPEAEKKESFWGLFQTDEYGEIEEQMTGLHELVLSFDPSGKQMKP